MRDTYSPTSSPAYFFELAEDQNVKLNLYFIVDRCQFSFLSAPCIKVKNGYFAVRTQIPDPDTRSIVWGADVNGYFNVRPGRLLDGKNDEEVPCYFSTRLSRIYNEGQNSLYLVFPLPDAVEHHQRRFSRRVSLENGHAEEFGIWHGNMEGGDFETLPMLTWNDLANTPCEVGEISAGGMRLDVPDSAPVCARMSVNDAILLRGDFSTGARAADIFVLGSIARKMPNPEREGIMSVGCKFNAWRKMDAPSSLAWFRVDPREGIGLIAEWIARNYRGPAR